MDETQPVSITQPKRGRRAVAEESKPKVKHIYTAINAVMREIVKVGVGKERNNKEQGYAFRGIEDVMNVLSPMLANHGIIIFPSFSDRTVNEGRSKNNAPLFYVTLQGQFTLLSSIDESSHLVTVYGEGMDSADKATNKAMTAAEKNMLTKTFAVPFKGMVDADSETPQPASKSENDTPPPEQRESQRSTVSAKPPTQPPPQPGPEQKPKVQPTVSPAASKPVNPDTRELQEAFARFQPFFGEVLFAKLLQRYGFASIDKIPATKESREVYKSMLLYSRSLEYIRGVETANRQIVVDAMNKVGGSATTDCPIYEDLQKVCNELINRRKVA